MSASPKWPDLHPGTELRIVKLAPDGHEVTSYTGYVFDADAPKPWIATRAEWTTRLVELDGLQFVPGDRLHEFFSPEDPFNVFSIWTPDGLLRGWYANVTHPSWLDPTTQPISMYWHDLYIDVIALPDNTVAVRDEDELDASGLVSSDPKLGAMIIEARDELLRRFERRDFPFHESPD
jgi:predicted RNA-binding protein associated with RNAse of E/G family